MYIVPVSEIEPRCQQFPSRLEQTVKFPLNMNKEIRRVIAINQLAWSIGLQFLPSHSPQHPFNQEDTHIQIICYDSGRF